jgi:type III restriction enzyme
MENPGGLENPILTSPYEAPERHFVIGTTGPTGEIKDGRRPSESYIPVPVGKKAASAVVPEQQGLDFDITGERRDVNSLINDIPHGLSFGAHGATEG